MMIDNGEIKEEEGWTQYSKMMKLPKSFAGFMREFKEITNIQLIRGTQVKRKMAPWEMSDKQFDF